MKKIFLIVILLWRCRSFFCWHALFPKADFRSPSLQIIAADCMTKELGNKVLRNKVLGNKVLRNKVLRNKEEKEMRVEWFENPDHVAYVSIEDFAENFGKEVGIAGFREKLEAFRDAPAKEGVTLIGKRRSTLKLFVPNMVFDRKIDMGDSVWVYIGEMYPAYCVYWPEGEGTL